MMKRKKKLLIIILIVAGVLLAACGIKYAIDKHNELVKQNTIADYTREIEKIVEEFENAKEKGDKIQYWKEINTGYSNFGSSEDSDINEINSLYEEKINSMIDYFIEYYNGMVQDLTFPSGEERDKLFKAIKSLEEISNEVESDGILDSKQVNTIKSEIETLIERYNNEIETSTNSLYENKILELTVEDVNSLSKEDSEAKNIKLQELLTDLDSDSFIKNDKKEEFKTQINSLTESYSNRIKEIEEEEARIQAEKEAEEKAAKQQTQNNSSNTSSASTGNNGIICASSLDDLLSKIRNWEIFYNHDGTVCYVLDDNTFNMYDANGQFIANYYDDSMSDLW